MDTRAIDLGPYRVLRILHRTRRALVVEGVHVARGLPVAIKVLGPRATVLDRISLRTEVRALARLHHPNIVEAYDAGEVGPEAAARADGLFRPGAAWIALELASGGTLADRVGATRWPELCALLVPLLGALAHAHARGVIHRDLKPSNVLLCGPGEPRPGPRLADFGLAVHDRPSAPLARGGGTDGFRAPEQVVGDWRAFGPPTDLYALGRLAEALRGPEGPWPEGFDDWIARLVDPAPEARFQVASEALSALRELAPTVEAVAARSAPASHRGTSLALLREPPLIGRSGEEASIARAADDALSRGEPRLLLIEAPSGVGATFLARHAARRLEERGATRTVRIAGSEAATAGRALAEAAAGALACHGATAEDVARSLRRALGDASEPAADPVEASGLLALLGPVLAPNPASRLAGPQERLGAFVTLLRALARRRPVLLAIDDAHWEPQALAVARQVLELSDPILVVATIRSDVLPACPETTREAVRTLREHARTETTRLEPLADVEIEELLQFRCTLSATDRRALARRAEGRPGVADQLLAAYVAHGGVPPKNRSASLFPTWSARVDALLARVDDATAVALAAILGETGTRWIDACALAGLTTPWRHVEPWIDAGLAMAGDVGRTWAFAHPSVAARLRERADAPRLHRWCAEVLAVDAADVSVREALVTHLVLGGRARDALEGLAAAIEARLDASDDARAEELLDLYARALDEAQVPPDDRRWGRHELLSCYVLRNRMQHDRLAERAAQLEQCARAHGWTEVVAASLRLAALAAFARGEPIDGAIERLHAGLELTEDPGMQARLWGDLGRLEKARARDMAARTAWARALSLYRELGDEIGTAITLMAPMPVDPAHDIAACDEALALFARNGDRLGMARAMLARGLAHQRTGALDVAEAEIAQAIVHYEAVASPRVALARTNLAILHVRRGAVARARPVLQSCLAIYEASRDRGWMLWCQAWLTAAAAADGDEEAFDAHLAEARRLTAPGSTVLAEALDVGADHAVAAGHVELARRCWALAGVLYERAADEKAARRVALRMRTLD